MCKAKHIAAAAIAACFVATGLQAAESGGKSAATKQCRTIYKYARDKARTTSHNRVDMYERLNKWGQKGYRLKWAHYISLEPITNSMYDFDIFLTLEKEEKVCD